MRQRVRNCDVLYLGERHDSEADHRWQAEVLGQLEGLQPVIVAEMFQLPSAGVLEAYSEGELDDDNLRIQSEWEQRWGHPWPLYLPLWQMARRHGWTLLPLRNSSESGKALGKLGVQAFTPAEREVLRPGPYEFGPHPESLRASFEAHAGKISDGAYDRFLSVQTLWEEFMAGQVRQALRRRERHGPVVVLVGKGHLLHGYGLAWRTQAGWAEPLHQIVLVNEPEDAEKKRLDGYSE